MHQEAHNTIQQPRSAALAINLAAAVSRALARFQLKSIKSNPPINHIHGVSCISWSQQHAQRPAVSSLLQLNRSSELVVMASRGGKPTGRAKHRSLKKTVRHKDTQLLNQNGSAIASVIDVLRGQLAQLEKEIVADRAGVKAYQVELQHLDRQKVEAEERLVTNREWAKQFDRDIGPFERK